MANILIVEDEKAMQDILADYMRKGGHTCFTADDGVDALVTLKNYPMDLIILDVMMPHLDGFSVCKMAREMSDMPIIMLTARHTSKPSILGSIRSRIIKSNVFPSTRPTAASPSEAAVTSCPSFSRKLASSSR